MLLPLSHEQEENMDERKAISRHPTSVRKPVLCALLLMVAYIPMSPATGDAQVTTNITSSGLNTQVNQAGNSYTITGGTRPGGGPNLFHSFGNFSVGAGDLANFLNNTGLPTSNILSRVTGGNISNIYGTIQTTGFGSANLFLMNPSGIVLGPGASLNVGGSVSFTTAQYLRLFDGVSSANFYANPANDGSANSILTINPSAFEFLSASPAGYGFLTAPDPNATITVQGSALSVTSGQSISFVGGEVAIEGGARLSAPTGNIKLASAASPGEFDVTTLGSLPNADGASFTSSGSVSLASGSSIDVHGTSTVLIKGGQLVLSVNNATLSTSENPVPPNTVSLSTGSSIVTSNSGTEPGADVQLIASNVHLADGSFLITQTSGPGRGGNIHLTADSLTLKNSSAIVTRNSELGLVGGNLFLNVGTLQLLGGDSGGSQIASINNTGTDLDGDGLVDVTGVGGNITIHGLLGTGSAADSVLLSGGSRMTSDAASTGGNGGGISIRATSLDLGEASTISSSTGGTGQGGNIIVSVQRLRLVDDATISSSTSSENPTPAAGGTVVVQGLAGPGSMASSVRLSGPNTGIITDSSVGVPGDISINAGTLTITNGAAIASGSSTSTGPGGKVTLAANSVSISADGQIFSRSLAQSSGQVTITADELTMDKGFIDTSTSSESGGRGGDVVLNGGTVSLRNGSRISSQSGSEETPFSTGRAGDITMNVGSLRLANRAEITSSSKGTVKGAAGDAGNITIRSGSTVVLDNSSITTEASQASGGQITINAPTMIRLIDSQVSTSVAGSANDSNGGNISIDPDFVILKGSQVLAQAFAGSGGAIGITAGLFLGDASSVVDASSTLGVSGTVQINAPINNLSSVVGRLSESLLAVQALLRAACAARLAQGATSSFVERGRDGIPAGPDGFLASPYLPITSENPGQRQATRLTRMSGIQLRRMLGQARPSSVIRFSDSTACSS
jgi:filamentous hemagglutinin family protein